MGIEIAPYGAEYVDNVREFNQRLAKAGEGDFQLPSDVRQFDKCKGAPLQWEGWLALQDGVVRGGYLLRKQQFSFGGQICPVAFYNLSPSEGAIDRAYASVSMKMVLFAMQREPMMFALGMGGIDNRLPRFLKALGWKLYEVPFLFRLVHPGPVLQNIATLRTTRWRRLILDAAAFSGVARMGIGALHNYRKWRAAGPAGKACAEEVPLFGSWADEVWRACKDSFAMIGVRDSQALNALYPGSMARLSRLKVVDRGALIGWAVVRNTKMSGHKHFGNLHVGTIVDCLSLEADAPRVAGAAQDFLESRGVDIIISNQCHRAWHSALLKLGFLKGRSNYILAASKELALRLDPFEKNVSRVQMTRGDGDGPIHL
jgi:hypothetical protein